MSLRTFVIAAAALVLTPLLLPAATITHDAVGCVVAEEFPRFTARVSPPEAVGRARVLFQAEGDRHWYAVAMSREGEAFTAVLPKPKATLARFRYYIEVADTAL